MREHRVEKGELWTYGTSGSIYFLVLNIYSNESNNYPYGAEGLRIFNRDFTIEIKLTTRAVGESGIIGYNYVGKVDNLKNKREIVNLIDD